MKMFIWLNEINKCFLFNYYILYKYVNKLKIYLYLKDVVVIIKKIYLFKYKFLCLCFVCVMFNKVIYI